MAAVRTLFVWAGVSGEAANLDPCATESQILLRPPNLVHVNLILERQIKVLPVHCIELIVRLLILPARSQVLTRNLFTGMESERGGYISCDFIFPYYQCHIFFREELELPAVVAVEQCCCDCLFCKSVTYTVELLNQC
jgi:hypothetical protein